MRYDSLQTRQPCKGLFRTSSHKALQLRPLPGIVLPILFEVANVAFIQGALCSPRWFDAFYCGSHLRRPGLGFLLLARLFAHAGDGVDRSRDVADGRSISILGSIPHSDVLRVVEVLGEGLRNCVELVFDHYVDIVCCKAGAHEFFRRRLRWRRGRGRSFW